MSTYLFIVCDPLYIRHILPALVEKTYLHTRPDISTRPIIYSP